MDLSLTIGGKRLSGPVGLASGTVGYGPEYGELIDFSSVAAVYTKAVTLAPRPGNDPPRLVETPSGLLNSIGLANVGVEDFVRKKAPAFAQLPCAIIANVAGSTEDEYAQVIERLEAGCSLFGYEINVSCPNVKKGCMAFGTDPALTASLVERLRRLTKKPLVVKLTPNAADIAAVASAAEGAGADAVSCINTLVGMVMDLRTGRPVLPAGTGGLSGPAIRPVGVACVYRVKRRVGIPVIGMGGIMSGEDALQYLLAGASAVQIGTGLFADPGIAARVLKGIGDFCAERGLQGIEDLHSMAGVPRGPGKR